MRSPFDPRVKTTSTNGFFPGRLDNAHVVIDLRERARLVRDRRAGGEAGGNAFVELLAAQDREHLLRTPSPKRPPVRRAEAESA